MAGNGKTYQITVQGTRNIEPMVIQEYRIIEAESQEAAETHARDAYYKEYPDIDRNTIDVSLKGKWNIMAVVCLAIPCLLSLVPWYGANGNVLSLAPGLTSSLMAIALYSAYIIRLKGLRNSFSNTPDIVLICLTIFFCASFLTLFLGDVPINYPFSKKVAFIINGKLLVCLAVIFSWLCMSAVAGVVWILVFLFALTRMFAVDNAMKFWGVVYVISAFLGIISMLKQESPYLLKSLRSDILGIGTHSAKRIRRDINASADTVKSVAGSIL